MKFAKSKPGRGALIKFVLLYGLSLCVIVPVVYFLFNTPATLFKKSIQQYKNSEIEQNRLLKKTDLITTFINKIIETDRSYQLATNVPDKEKLKETLGEYTNEVMTPPKEIKNDSTSRRSSYSRRDANNYLFLFRNFMDYRDA